MAAAAIGLAFAGVAAPIGAAVAAAADPMLWRPLVASALVALLVAAPAGAGLAAALAGLHRIAAAVREARGEAAYAAWRIAVALALFGYALLLPHLGAADAASAACVPIAATALALAWTVLLCVMLWPAAPAVRRLTTIVLDIALVSAYVHFGGRQVAGWYPLYIAVVLYAGLRFGIAALTTAGIAAAAGFAAVAVATPAWRGDPVLATGLFLALVLLPAPVAKTVRRLAEARRAAADAEAERRRLLQAISGSLRNPAGPTPQTAAQVSDILDLAALETGTFVSPVETFELRSLIRRRLSPLQTEAAERGIALRWRVDAQLPNRLRGHAEAVGRLVRSLAEHAMAAPPGPAVRLTIDLGENGGARIRLALRVETAEAERAGLDGERLSLRLVRRLAAIADGEVAIEQVAGRSRCAVTLPLAVEAGGAPPHLDLAGRAVLIVTEEAALAEELAEPVADWNGEPRWPSDPDQAIAELALAPEAKRAVVIIDGRDRLLAALGIVHQATKLGVNAPFVLLIAAAGQAENLLAVDDGGIDGIIPAPPNPVLIANALDALPLTPERTKPRANARAPLRPRPREDPPRRDAAQITPIAAHPKFAPDAEAIDARAIEGLQALGGDEAFLTELIEAFRLDAAQIMERIAAAATAADGAGFAGGLIALRRAAGQLGGVQLCALTASMQHLSQGELRQRGALYVQRLEAEIDRLTAALTAFAAAGQGGA